MGDRDRTRGDSRRAEVRVQGGSGQRWRLRIHRPVGLVASSQLFRGDRWLEVAGVSASAGLWLLGRRRDLGVQYRLQAWWADRIMASLRLTCGLHPEVVGADVFGPGLTIMFVRHASLADSLLTAWVITDLVGMNPRVVMKRELLVDPCLDIVGHRLPNCFVDRGAVDSTPELDAIASMSSGLGTGEVAVRSPRGPAPTRPSATVPSKRSDDPIFSGRSASRAWRTCCRHVPVVRPPCSRPHPKPGSVSVDTWASRDWMTSAGSSRARAAPNPGADPLRSRRPPAVVPGR